MNTNASGPALPRFLKFVWILACAACLTAVPAVRALGPAGNTVYVNYSTNSQPCQGFEPFNFSYVLKVTSPAGTAPSTVTLNVTPTTVPDGSTVAAAQNYVWFSSSTLNFTGPGQTIAVTVFVSVPISSATGAFVFTISSSGWNAVSGYTIIDNNTLINATVSPPSTVPGPTVAITTPANGTYFTHVTGTTLYVPITVTGDAVDAAVVTTLTATISATDAAGNPLSTPALSLTNTGLGTAHVDGQVIGGYPVTQPGIYTIAAHVENSAGVPLVPVGNSDTTSTFIVNEVVGPIVTITAPAPGTSFLLSSVLPGVGGVEMDFNGTSQDPSPTVVITKLTHQVDNLGINTVPSSTLNQKTAYGTVTLPVTTAGLHTFYVTATDSNGTAAAQSTFNVTDDLTATVTGVVFKDANPNNGQLDSGEPGIAGVRVSLKDSTGTALVAGPTTTAADGSYAFSAIAAGSYTIVVDATTAPTGYTLTTNNIPQTVIVSSGSTSPVSPTGFTPPVVINTMANLTGLVFADMNTSHGFDTGDTGIAGVTVTVTNATGVQVGTATTNSSGAYLVILPEGTYTVSVGSLPSGYTGYTLSTSNNTQVVTLKAPGTAAGAVGFAPPPPAPVNLTGMVFYDANSNGVQDLPTDKPEANVPVQLFDSTGKLITTVNTNSSGIYTFTIVPGNYTVIVGGVYGLVLTTPANTAHYAVTLTSLGYTAPKTGYGPLCVSGLVFFDVNCNGIRNTQDYGLGCVTVKLLKLSSGGCGWGYGYTTVATTTTASDGTYKFLNVATGSYTVSVCDPNGFTPSTLTDWDIKVCGANYAVPDTGYSLDFCAIQRKCAGGYTIGYWKNNIDKNLSGRCGGTQVTLSTLQCDTSRIAARTKSPFCGITMPQASSTMGCTSSAPVDLLKKQLVACDYNYTNGGYIDNDERLTNAFVSWGENVALNYQSYPSSYVLWAQAWCNAYNNSHGGYVCGPNP